MSTEAPSAGRSATMKVRSNRDEFVETLPVEDVEWLRRQAPLSDSMFAWLREARLIEPVGEDGEYTVWRTTPRLAACVERIYGEDALLSEDDLSKIEH